MNEERQVNDRLINEVGEEFSMEPEDEKESDRAKLKRHMERVDAHAAAVESAMLKEYKDLFGEDYQPGVVKKKCCLVVSIDEECGHAKWLAALPDIHIKDFLPRYLPHFIWQCEDKAMTKPIRKAFLETVEVYEAGAFSPFRFALNMMGKSGDWEEDYENGDINYLSHEDDDEDYYLCQRDEERLIHILVARALKEYQLRTPINNPIHWEDL